MARDGVENAENSNERARQLEEKLLEIKGQLAHAVAQNEKLSYTLRESRDHIASLRDEVEKLTQPPSGYGVIVGKNDDSTVDILSSGRKMRVTVHPEIDLENLERGAEVVLNESFNVVKVRVPESIGEVVHLKEVLEDGIRAVVTGRGDDERVCELADSMRGTLLRSGDLLRMDPKSNLLLERLTQPEIEHLLLEEVPDISYADIGGLDSQIEQKVGARRRGLHIKMEAQPHQRSALSDCQGHRYLHMKYQELLQAVSAQFLAASSVQGEGLTLDPFAISHHFAIRCRALNLPVHRLAHRRLYP